MEVKYKVQRVMDDGWGEGVSAFLNFIFHLVGLKLHFKIQLTGLAASTHFWWGFVIVVNVIVTG